MGIIEDLIEGTQAEVELLVKQKQELIAQKKALLQKYKEDVEQVELFGLSRDDYEQKKQLCASLILELRELQK